MTNKQRHLKQEKRSIDLKSLAECAECTCFNLRKAARVVTQLFDESMRSIGLRGTQFTLLAHTLAHGPITVSKLADILVTDRTTLARNLEPLEKNGFIEVQQGEDRRTRMLSITDEGRNKVAEAFPLWKKTQDEIKEMIGIENWKSMMSDVSGLVEQLQETQ
ncbi:MAG: MarR family winged helix-turn-helix transcriptional regulator [Deltaproteobacteria bacterium]